ncbi:XRE family transcriptional regulator [Glutamicibacter sp.]|uniref:XRE family transcriptional regulator n=1 Tax=Glutamicibacter sp. TaxID=1931995 RepID=UPI003D6A6D99
MKIVQGSTSGYRRISTQDVAAAFDPRRLIQARRIEGLTKTSLARQLDVTPMSVTHWESGSNQPNADHIVELAQVLNVPEAFFAIGRPYIHVSQSDAHFRSLRRTPVAQRQKATAYVEQVWELTYALEKYVRLPEVDVPGLSNGESTSLGLDPADAARHVRNHWKLGLGPIPRVVRTLEKHGIILTLAEFAGESTPTVDAFSTSRLPRPIIVLTPERAKDVYRHRFTAAHELGHLVLHGESAHGDVKLEKEADEFAAEFLTPEESITPLLPSRMDLRALDQLSKEWGVSIESLIYRCRELGIVSDSAYRRAFQRLNQLRKVELFVGNPVNRHPGEMPILLREAFKMAEIKDLPLPVLADELAMRPARVRQLLGITDRRPKLAFV